MSGPYYKPGRYIGKVVKQSLGETSKGNAQFVLNLSIIGMVDPSAPSGDLLACGTGERTVYRVITENTIDWVKRDLDVLRFAGMSFAELDPNCPNFQNFAGQEVELTCDHEEYEGTVKERWNIYHGGGGPDVKPLDSAAIRKLDALFGKELKKRAKPQTDEGNGAAAPTVARAVAAEAAVESDDQKIPF